MKSVLLLLVLLLTACGSGGNYIPPAVPENCYIPGSGGIVYSYGDSIAHGVEASSIFNCSLNYAMDFAQNNSFTFVNYGVGSTTIDSPNQIRLAKDKFINGAIITWEDGLNDVSIYGIDPDHLAVFQQDLTDILNNLASQNVKVYIGTTIPPLNRPDLPPAQIAVYVNLIKQVVSTVNAPNVYLVDYNSLYVPTSANTLSDNTHPNAQGFEELATIFQQAYQSSQ